MKEIEDHKFTWGDPIVIAKSAPIHVHLGEFASICGFYRITSEESAEEFQCNIGDWIYTVEFQDGSSIELAECYLEKYECITQEI